MRLHSCARAAGRAGPVAVCLVVVAVHAVDLSGYPAFSGDEGIYTAQALAFWDGGRLSPYTYWYDHPPLGWVQLAPLVVAARHLLGAAPVVVAARAAMLVPLSASALLLHVLARRLGLGRGAALVAVLLWGASPLTVTESRQVLLDGLALPWVLGASCLALDRRRDVYRHTAAGAVLAGAVLTKETCVLLVPAVVLAVWHGSSRSTRVFSCAGVLMALVLTTATYPLVALTRGELVPGRHHVSLWQGVVWQLAGRAGSGSVLQGGSDARTVVHSWLQTDPVLPVAGLAAALACWSLRSLRPVALAVTVPVLVALRPGGYLPAMLVTDLLPFLALAVVGVGVAGLRAARRRGAGPTALGALGAALAAWLVTAAWWPGLTAAEHGHHDRDYVSTLAWIDRHVPRDAVIVTDPVAWDDLVAAGRPADGWSGPVWSYTYSHDPAARRHLPRAWRDVDYLLATAPMRREARSDARVADLLAHSTPVAVFGPLQVRAVVPGDRS